MHSRDGQVRPLSSGWPIHWSTTTRQQFHLSALTRRLNTDFDLDSLVSFFFSLRSLKLGLADYQKFLEELAKAKKVELDEIRDKMIQCGPPGTTGTTVYLLSDIAVHSQSFIIYLCLLFCFPLQNDRLLSKQPPSTGWPIRLNTPDPTYVIINIKLTDKNLFINYTTITRKRMRFDESGRGRGIEGRRDKPDGSGYVQGYGNKNSYDKSH